MSDVAISSLELDVSRLRANALAMTEDNYVRKPHQST